MIESGIYIIRNIVNNHIYIGSTKDFSKREYSHFNSLKNNKHHSKYLQNAFNKYGEDNFKFEVIHRTKKIGRLINIELKYIEIYKPEYNFMDKKGYNLVGDYDNNICPICNSKLYVNDTSIVNFLKGDNNTKICSNKFCSYSIDKNYKYEIKKINYR
jgi:group I intron endonuclease